MVETWPYFIELALSVIFLVFIAIASYGAPADIRKWKFVAAFWVYLAMVGVTGFLGLGLTYYDRDDGVETQWGRWAMFAATHGAVVSVVVISMSYSFIDWALGFLLGTGSAVFLLFGSLVPARNCGNMLSASILATVLSGVCVLATFWLLLAIARGWRRLLLFPADYRATDGRANVMNSWWLTLTAVAVFVGLSLYTILFALGPEGIPTSCGTGKSNKPVYTSEYTQIWLLFAVADGIVKFIALPLIFYFVNQDGQVSSTAYEVMQPAEQVMLAQQINSGVRVVL